MSILGVPTLIGYTAFLRDPVGIPTIALPDGAPAIAFSLAISEAIVSQWRLVAEGIGLSLSEQNRMANAFRLAG